MHRQSCYVHLAVAGDVFNGVFLCCPFFPLDVLAEIWDLIESVSEGFLTYSCISELLCLCCVEILKNLPVHSFNALIIPILRVCLPNYFLVFLSFDVYLIVLLTWLSLVMSLMASFCAVLFPTRCLGSDRGLN